MAQLPYQPVPGVALVKATYRQGTNLMSNTFHVHQDGGWSGTDLDALLQVYYDWDNLDGKAERSASVELVYLTGADLTANNAAYRARAIDPAVGGLNTGQALPLNCTLAVTAVTGTRGRGTQGRTFWVGLTENQVDENVVTNTTKANIVDNMNSLLAAINANTGWTMCVPHRYVAGVRVPSAGNSPIVVYTVRDTTVDTQKLRLPNHRRSSGCPVPTP